MKGVLRQLGNRLGNRVAGELAHLRRLRGDPQEHLVGLPLLDLLAIRRGRRWRGRSDLQPPLEHRVRGGQGEERAEKEQGAQHACDARHAPLRAIAGMEPLARRLESRLAACCRTRFFKRTRASALPGADF